MCGLESEVGLRLRFNDNGVDEVRAEIVVNRKYQGYPGVVHGGIAAAMLDETGGRVVMITNPNRFMMTAKLDLKYRKPVPVETPLLVIGRLIRDRGRLAEAHAEIRLPDDSLTTEADITLIQIPVDYLPNVDLDALGWRVYPGDGDSA